ncbi:unnamed protein product [Kluyveromyces dobzhanskii CBS 2104]|uniref:WGS project CCBQ000000000 data, contig 00046 n=1 Tax=Kluyveromyces dobzhanskii CBS 2104 TaxID=1427455 RepID=A0A0A8L9C6_9SACH|nr:unnamed protein product [Kluyveromyces dobzhanskii CBS 2104]
MGIRNGRVVPLYRLTANTILLVTVSLFVCGLHLSKWSMRLKDEELFESDSLCPNPRNLRPLSYMTDNSTLEMVTHDVSYRAGAVEKLLGSVRIPTESFDDHLDPLEFPQYYKNFAVLHEYFRKTYPEVHKTLKLERTAYEYNLVYTWQGTDSSLKPLVLAGHQDVVPVNAETIGQWGYGPYEGVFDGEDIYGRGVADCKALLNSILESVELLIKYGFEPSRTVILAFGFDEEVGGGYGAQTIGEFLLDKYGENGIYAIVDEGGSSVEQLDGTYFALPAVGEKGSLTSLIQLNTKGGHSSVPPENTGIGIMADLIHSVETTPYKPFLDLTNPFLKYLYCMVEHTENDDIGLPRSQIRHYEHNSYAREHVVEWIESHEKFKWLSRTTQAADIFHSGFKVNALPEVSKLYINHRINIGSNCKDTELKIMEQAEATALKYGLGLIYKGETVIEDTTGLGTFHFETSQCLEPAPVSPTHGYPEWEEFAGTVRHILEDITYPGAKIVVAPSITTGNTDTAKYWKLTENIYRYRFSTTNAVTQGHIHGINETISAKSYMNMIAFAYEYIQNSCH